MMDLKKKKYVSRLCQNGTNVKLSFTLTVCMHTYFDVLTNILQHKNITEHNYSILHLS